MATYQPRIQDDELTHRLQTAGAVLIEGPKACGKTSTAQQVAATIFEMDQDPTARASLDVNPAYLFENPYPILFDEWQVTPELWNRVRHTIDKSDHGRGLFILTGSATPRDDINRHSGAGRFSVLPMRTMSLFETGHSNGEVSLDTLMEGKPQPGTDNAMTVPQLMERIIIGGWPDLLDADETEARQWLRDYLSQIIEVDVPSFVGRRDPRTLERVVQSLARYTAQSPTTRAITADVAGDRGSVTPATIYSHLDALRRLRLLDDSEAWQPHMRSRSRLRTTPTRYFVDPSIATSALRVTSKDLLNDLPAAGYLFEALVVRDLRIYAQSLGGRVDTWRDENGNEIDAVITLDDGRWAAVEIKMNNRDAAKAASNLLRITQKIDTSHHGSPSALIVITATGVAGKRPDGVHIAPITTLRP